MQLEFSKSFSHCAYKREDSKPSEKELQEIMLQLMEKSGIDTNQVENKEEGKLEIKGSADGKLHKIILEAEEMGLEMKFTQKTVIEIC